MLDSGQIIADRYELLKQLGRGGFSEVWLAQDKLTDGRHKNICSGDGA
jgi:serine/threonine protein kinase